ncbi:MAG: hypothetical protein WD004_06165 [Actinomycetota bacterium]
MPERELRSGRIAQDESTGLQEPVVRPLAGEGIDRRAEAVARQRSLLEAFGIREGIHASLEYLQERVGICERVEQPAHRRQVPVAISAAVARGEAPAHVRESAGREPRPFSHRLRAAADREDFLERLLREPGLRG